MKRVVFIGIALILICVCVMATAWSSDPLPHSIYDALNGYTILGQAQLAGWGTNDCWFVAARNTKGTVYLFQYKQQDGTWKEQFHTHDGIPQSKYGYQLCVSSAYLDHVTSELACSGPTLYIGVEDEGGQYWESTAVYVLYDNIWKLVQYSNCAKKYCLVGEESKLSYYTGENFTTLSGSATGYYQRDLRYVSLSSLPKSLSAAKSRLTSASALPYSQELKAKEVKFTGGKNYEVYSAPGKNSLRGANGKAKVSTNGWVQVFGQEGDWIMIQYSINTSQYRIGYIKKSSLPKGTTVRQLDFNSTSMLTNRSVSVTDDPLYSQSTLANLESGTPVKQLATIGTWAYIETTAGTWLRGFVPMTSLQAEQAISENPHSFNGTDKIGSNGIVFSIAPDDVITADAAWQLALHAIYAQYGLTQEALSPFTVSFGYSKKPDDFGGVPYWQFDFENPEDPLDSYEIMVSAKNGKILYTCGPG